MFSIPHDDVFCDEYNMFCSGCITDKFTFSTVDANNNPTTNGSGLLIATETQVIIIYPKIISAHLCTVQS